jgi:hypothetical protein
MTPDLLTLDDLPADARALIEAAEHDEITIRDRAERQIDEVRARANQAIADIQARADQAVSELQAGADDEVRSRQLQLLAALKPLQERYLREGKLDEALAIRDRIRGLKSSMLRAQPDPGTLSGVEEPQPGTSLLFEVIGREDGAVWGTDVYTHDSTLGAAAVHAGVLRPGERGVVRVTWVDTLNVAFNGSERNGVESQSYGPWPVGFRFSRV